jgi:hypothetical protein
MLHAEQEVQTNAESKKFNSDIPLIPGVLSSASGEAESYPGFKLSIRIG